MIIYDNHVCDHWLLYLYEETYANKYVCYVQVDASWPIQRLTRSCQLCLEPGISPNSRSFSEYGWASAYGNPGRLPVALSQLCPVSLRVSPPSHQRQNPQPAHALEYITKWQGTLSDVSVSSTVMRQPKTNLLKSLYPIHRSKNHTPKKNAPQKEQIAKAWTQVSYPIHWSAVWAPWACDTVWHCPDCA